MVDKYSRLRQLLSNLHRDESAQDTVEYGLLGCLMALAVIVGEEAVASSINTVFISLGNKMNVPGV
ncbi:MAG TPA: Flp family type IVb pilin [Terriglobia bacterium]|nr:Flp family type IVb pilin [Terriglobia bacterium]